MKQNSVRIVGGKWRGRKIDFPSVDGLRPTPDRVRETLFNWLMHDITDATCLDLFAGSGANGFEALSRGAKSATFVELSNEAFQLLQANKEKLHAEDAILYHQDALAFLEKHDEKFDVIFLDPPFQSNLIAQCFEHFKETPPLNPGGYLYIESPIKKPLPALPAGYTLLKEKQAGELRYTLLRYESGGVRSTKITH